MLLAAGMFWVGLSWSQPPALSPLTVTPAVCEKNDTITLRFTPASPLRRNRLDVVITDAYRGGELAKAGREFRPDGGGLRLVQSFRADAGIYAVQVFDGKNPLTEKAFFIVPGLDRVERKEESRRPRRDEESAIVDEKDEGWWLVNGYPVSGFVWDGGAFPAEQSSWLRPTVTGGIGFNAAILSVGSGFDLSHVVQHGASVFASLESLVGVGLHGANNVPMFNPRGEPQTAGCFNAPQNRARLLNDLKRFQQSVVSSGTLPRAFGGLHLFQPRLPGNTYTCYCSYCAEEFRAFVRERYGDVSKFNARHKLSVHSFAEVEPPRHDSSSSSLWNDWQDFRFQIVPRFATWLRGEANKLFPERVLGIFGDSLLSFSAGNAAAGRNPFEGVDEGEWGKSKSLDVLGVLTAPEDVADRVDFLYAAADVDVDGYPNKPVWATYDSPLTRVEAILHGASGTFLKGNGEIGKLGDEVAGINRFLNQYANLFTGARAIGEVGVVVPRATFKYAREAQTVRNWVATLAGIQEALRRNHRTKRIVFPERGIVSQRQPSALFVPLGEMVSDDFLKQLKVFVEEGGAVYLEGLPLRDETGTVVGDRLKDLIGAEVEEVPRRVSEMTVDDVWVFGTANKMRLPIQVRGTIKKLIERTPEKKDQRLPEKPRVIATLPDGSPAVIVNELSKPKSALKGMVIYTPHCVGRDAAMAYLDRVRQTHDPATPFDQRYVDYYGAIADYLSPPLVRMKGNNVSEVRVGALLPNRNVLLVGLINYGAEKKSLELFVRTATSHNGDFQDISIYDLRQRAWLKPLLPQAAVVRLRYELAAHDWAMLAFTNYRRASDFEKFLSEPRFKVTLK